jgi:hypothetical protein
MLISEKQQAANRQNAQHSTGPKTPEGKARVRFNALTWSLRARSLMLPGDDPADYQSLWDALAAEWQPQTHTERYYLEQMSVAQWLLTRTAESENRIHQAGCQLGRELELLDRVDAKRVRLERSFTTAMHELEHLQTKREAKNRQHQPVQPEQTAETADPASTPPAAPAEPHAPPPDYVMSEQTDAHPISCAPATPDTR